MKNLEVVQILNTIADILELQNVQWKPQAYRKAARSIEALSEDIAEIAKRGELRKIPGIGEAISEKIEEIIKTGKLRYYEQLKKDIKIDLEQLSSIPGLGPKKIKVLYEKLKIKNISDLEKAIRQKKLHGRLVFVLGKIRIAKGYVPVGGVPGTHQIMPSVVVHKPRNTAIRLTKILHE